MITDGCQGKKSIQLQEKVCPNCGSIVELAPNEAAAACDSCGYMLFNDKMDCVWHCSMARECVGEAYYAKLMAARKQWEQQMQSLKDDDEW